MAELIGIHEHFADGGRPSDLAPGTARHRVYEAERAATAALVAFYEVSVGGSFDETISEVKRFARADARRFALRDRLRAEAIATIVSVPGTYHIEAAPYPHTRDELAVGATVARLSMADFRRLFAAIHRAPTAIAKKMVRRYLKRATNGIRTPETTGL